MNNIKTIYLYYSDELFYFNYYNENNRYFAKTDVDINKLKLKSMSTYFDKYFLTSIIDAEIKPKMPLYCYPQKKANVKKHNGYVSNTKQFIKKYIKDNVPNNFIYKDKLLDLSNASAEYYYELIDIRKELPLFTIKYLIPKKTICYWHHTQKEINDIIVEIISSLSDLF